MTKDQVKDWMAAAGFAPVQEFDGLNGQVVRGLRPADRSAGAMRDMPNRRTFLIGPSIAPLAVRAADRRGDAGRAGASAVPAAAVPPLSWSCPMHAEVVDNAPGKCPICGMTLEPVRLALVWTCTVHSATSRSCSPGNARAAAAT